MIKKVKIAPIYGIVFVADAANRSDRPEIVGGRSIFSNESCIAIGCKADIDGETEFLLGPAEKIDLGHRAAFEGNLMTPSGRIMVTTAEMEKLLELLVVNPITSISIWTNHPTQPDKVIIGVR